MSYFAAGAWWTADGRSFRTQAEADAAERAPVAQSSGEDAFARASGRGAARSQQAPANGRNGAQPQTAAPDPNAFNRRLTPQAQASRDAAGSDTGFFEDPLGKGLSTVSSFYKNPILNPITAAATAAGPVVDRAVGNVFDRGIDAVARAAVGSDRVNVATDLRPSVSGYIQDPLGQAAADFGAPALVQGALNPTGFGVRTAVNANTGYGLNPAAVVQQVGSAARNVVNDVRNAPGVIGDAANAASGFVGNLVNQVPAVGRSNNAPATGYTPAALPTPSMTPEQILGMNTNAVRPSSAQQDQIVQQMLAQSNVQSGYQDFNSPQYDASRGAAMGYTSQLAGLANNNVAVTGLDAGRYDQSRGTVNQITGQLQGQANNNVADIQANSAQRDQSRNAVMDTANVLGNNANRNIGPVTADQRERLSAGAGLDQTIGALRFTGGPEGDVADIQSDQANYAASTARQNEIIDMLIAQAQQQEGPSAAESLMLNAQERAQRNAYGDAASLSGGWRSQLTGQRRAMGQAASQQADIAAQLGALRANEAATFRGQSIGALGTAGGYAGDIAGRDSGLAQFDAALLAQIQQGNQTNQRESLLGAGQLGLGRLTDASGFATNEADRQASIEMANQNNRLNSLLGAGNLQTGAMVSDTGLAQSNASLLAQIRQGNQANALASLTAAGQNAGQVLNSDVTFASNDADIRARREIANQTNATTAMLGAANAANTTAGFDANIGTSNADRRAQVDQNNRANSLTALQNAGVLSSATRGQDVQLSVADQAALSSRISSAAGLAGTTFATQVDAALRITDQELRRQQFEFMKTQAPREYERWLAAGGATLGLLGIL